MCFRFFYTISNLLWVNCHWDFGFYSLDCVFIFGLSFLPLLLFFSPSFSVSIQWQILSILRMQSKYLKLNAVNSKQVFVWRLFIIPCCQALCVPIESTDIMIVIVCSLRLVFIVCIKKNSRLTTRNWFCDSVSSVTIVWSHIKHVNLILNLRLRIITDFFYFLFICSFLLGELFFWYALMNKSRFVPCFQHKFQNES